MELEKACTNTSLSLPSKRNPEDIVAVVPCPLGYTQEVLDIQLRHMHLAACECVSLRG